MYIDEIAHQIASELEPGRLPDEGNVDRLLRSYAVLACVKGGEATLEDVHDVWAAWMVEVNPDHPALRPFAELDHSTRQEDEPFLRAVLAIAER